MYKTILFLLLALPALHGCLLVAGAGVAAGAGVVHDRRDASQVIRDRRMSIASRDAIDRDSDLSSEGNYVHTIVYDGVVLLCGEVHSEEQKRRAQEKAEALDGVKRIVNEIEITDEPQGFWRRRTDNLLTAHVKTALLDITSLASFDPTRVNVTTVHGTVFLMGMVSHEEAEATVEVARNVGGVARVVKVFEYTD